MVKVIIGLIVFFLILGTAYLFYSPNFHTVQLIHENFGQTYKDKNGRFSFNYPKRANIYLPYSDLSYPRVFAEGNSKGSSCDLQINKTNPPPPANAQKSIFNGVEWKRWSVDDNTGDFYDRHITFWDARVNGNRYVVMTQNNFKEYCDKLVSTFKFDRNNQNIKTTFDFVDTNNWSLYTNSKLGFSIKLPLDWKVDDLRSNRERSGDDVVFDIGIPESHEGISADPAGTKTVDDLVGEFNPEIILSIKDIVVDGEKGKQIQTGEFATSYAFVKHKDKIYTFSGNRLFSDNILYTFQFLK